MLMRMVSIDLSMLKGPDFLLSGKKYRLGRSSDCSFVIKDLSVSRVHAELLVEQESVVVKDLGSLNGTFVDGTRVKEAKLQPGQAVVFGHAQFRLAGHDVRVTGDEVSEVSTHAVNKKDPAVKTPLRQLATLSEGQRRVLDLLLSGRSEKEVACELVLSPHTIHNHVKEIYRKMNVSSRAELLALFVPESKRIRKTGG